MGARIAAELALAHPERVRSAVFGGLGDAMVTRRLFAPVEPLIAALRAPSLDDVTDPRGRTYRALRRSDEERSRGAGGVPAGLPATD